MKLNSCMVFREKRAAKSRFWAEVRLHKRELAEALRKFIADFYELATKIRMVLTHKPTDFCR